MAQTKTKGLSRFSSDGEVVPVVVLCGPNPEMQSEEKAMSALGMARESIRNNSTPTKGLGFGMPNCTRFSETYRTNAAATALLFSFGMSVGSSPGSTLICTKPYHKQTHAHSLSIPPNKPSLPLTIVLSMQTNQHNNGHK